MHLTDIALDSDNFRQNIVESKKNKGDFAMRIEIDTEKNLIIVPNTYYEQIDRKNQVLSDAGVDTKIDYTQYIRDSFNKAIESKIIRKEDLKRNK